MKWARNGSGFLGLNTKPLNVAWPDSDHQPFYFNDITGQAWPTLITNPFFMILGVRPGLKLTPDQLICWGQP